MSFTASCRRLTLWWGLTSQETASFRSPKSCFEVSASTRMGSVQYREASSNRPARRKFALTAVWGERGRLPRGMRLCPASKSFMGKGITVRRKDYYFGNVCFGTKIQDQPAGLYAPVMKSCLVVRHQET